ncbi:MAG: lipid II flippase MurJ [Peptostreptococcus anaerobius]
MKSNKVVKNVVLLMSLTLLSKFVGFFREQVMSYYYGASMYSDIYFSAYDIPKILFSLLAASLATTYIPMYNRVVEEKGEERANVFTNNVLNLTLLVGFLISVVAFIFMEPIVKVFAYGFKGETFNETVKFTGLC